MKKIPALLCLFFLLLASGSYAGRLADREVLGNGMILLHAERKNLPVVTVVMAVKAGSVAEPADKAGLAYLTAALLNEGTGKRSSQQISESIEFVGGALAASANTEYATITLTVLKKDLELGFDLLSDIVMKPAFSEEELKRKKKSIINGLIQQNEDPGTVASIAFAKAVFGDHPYGRQVQGTRESIETITRKDIVDFHAGHYAPDNAILSVAGDISGEELKTLIDKHFRNWQQKKAELKTLPDLKPKERPAIIRINKDLTQSNIILGHIGVTRDDPDYYVVMVMNYILGGGGFGSRLMDNIRDSRGLAYDVHSYFSAYRHGGSFQAGLQTKNDTAGLAIDEMLKEMEKIRTEPVSDIELAEAKAYLTGNFPLRIDSNSKIANFNLAVEYFGLGPDYSEQYPSIINAVTKEDILRAAKKHLDTKNYVLVVVGDIEKAKLNY